MLYVREEDTNAARDQADCKSSDLISVKKQSTTSSELQLTANLRAPYVSGGKHKPSVVQADCKPSAPADMNKKHNASRASVGCIFSGAVPFRQENKNASRAQADCKVPGVRSIQRQNTTPPELQLFAHCPGRTYQFYDNDMPEPWRCHGNASALSRHCHDIAMALP